MKVEFFKHSIGEEDIQCASSVLRSLFLTTGEVVNAFEKDLAEYLHVGQTVGVTSCTAALQLSLMAWGIGPGDEVITTPLSFCATSNAILHTGAVPVFVDVESGTGNMDAHLVEARITDRTRAILPVHLYGHMCDMRKIRQIAHSNNLVVVEDAAHCIEGIRDGIRPGEISEAACVSFHAIKNITSGEGGAIVTDNHEKAKQLRLLRLHGMDKTAADRFTEGYRHWDMLLLGWKYNMDNIHAALLIGQLKKIEELWSRRDMIWTRYEEGLGGVNGIELTTTAEGVKHARHLFAIRVDPDRRDPIIIELQKRGIGVGVHYRPIHLLDYYKKNVRSAGNDYPVAEQIGAQTISLPLYPKLSDDEVAYVIDTVKNVVNRTGDTLGAASAEEKG